MSYRKSMALFAACGAVWGAAALSAPAAHAQRISPMVAGRFVQFCNAPRGGQQVCDAYISGMADSYALVQKTARTSNGGAIKPDICVPTSTSGAAMRGMVVSWIEAHKDRMSNKVGEVVYLALHDSYPCDASKSGGPG